MLDDGTPPAATPFFRAMYDQSPALDDAEIARHEVSEDGVTWRPYDASTDANRTLHTRIVFAPPRED